MIIFRSTDVFSCLKLKTMMYYWYIHTTSCWNILYMSKLWQYFDSDLLRELIHPWIITTPCRLIYSFHVKGRVTLQMHSINPFLFLAGSVKNCKYQRAEIFEQIMFFFTLPNLLSCSCKESASFFVETAEVLLLGRVVPWNFFTINSAYGPITLIIYIRESKVTENVSNMELKGRRWNNSLCRHV